MRPTRIRCIAAAVEAWEGRYRAICLALALRIAFN
jgi:hypothetical protein